jgi:hypothetical protein
VKWQVACDALPLQQATASLPIRSSTDIIVNDRNDFLETVGSYDADRPFGPYECLRYGKAYSEDNFCHTAYDRRLVASSPSLV